MTKLFNNNIKKLAQKMSLESKINIVGSASVKRSIYYSDYDLFERVSGKSETVILNHFISLFNIIKASQNVVISDFKCGHDEKNNPLRWDFSDIHKGINNGIKFEDALKMKGIIKIDLISFIGGRFIEISETYNISIDGSSNMDYSKDKIVNDILQDYKDLVKDDNYMKALKRLFSIMKLNNPDDKRLNMLMNYFNSPIGLLYRCKADLETILLILSYNKFDINDIKNSLQIIKEQVSAFDVENNIEKISSMKIKADMKTPLRIQINRIKEYVNKDAKKFLQTSGL